MGTHGAAASVTTTRIGEALRMLAARAVQTAGSGSAPTPGPAAGNAAGGVGEAGAGSGAAAPDSGGLSRTVLVGILCVATLIVLGIGAFLAYKLRRRAVRARAHATGGGAGGAGVGAPTAAGAGKPDDGFPAGGEDEGSPADAMMTWERIGESEGGGYDLGGSAELVSTWARALEARGAAAAAGAGGPSPVPPALGGGARHTRAVTVCVEGTPPAAPPRTVSLQHRGSELMEALRRHGTPLDGSLHDFTQAVRNSPCAAGPAAGGRAHTPLATGGVGTRMSPATPSASPPVSPDITRGASGSSRAHGRTQSSADQAGGRRSSDRRHKKALSTAVAASARELQRLTPSPSM